MKKSIALATVALIALVGLVGCEASSSPKAEVRYNIIEVRQPLSDGRSVTCLINKDHSAGGFSCDWENAK